MTDYFTLLGISKDATDDEVRRGYRTMAKLYHPDKNSAADSTEKFKDIGQAYEALKSQDSREIYKRQFDKKDQKAKCAGPAAETANKKADYCNSERHASSFDFRGEKSGRSAHSTKEKFNEKTPRSGDTKWTNEKPEAKSSSSENVKPNKNTDNKARSKRSARKPTTKHRFSHRPSASLFEEDAFAFSSFTEDPFDYPTVFETFFKINLNLGGAGRTRTGTTSPPFKYMNSPSPSPFYSKPQPQRSGSDSMRYPNHTDDDVETDEMYNWSKPLFNYWSRGENNVEEFDEYDPDVQTETRKDFSGTSSKCSFCYKMFSYGALHEHEEHCGQFRPETPPQVWSLPTNKRASWREEHEGLHQYMRQVRQRARTAKSSLSDYCRETPKDKPGKDKPDLSFCHWCRTTFKKEEAQDHKNSCYAKSAAKGRKHFHPTTSKT